MRADGYAEMARVEDTHWWFRGRRAIIKHVISKAGLPKPATILDAGSGTGGNLAMLSSFGKLFSMEMDDNAREFANARGVVEVVPGALPDEMPFKNQQFDLIIMSDVLEHIERDHDTLTSLHTCLAPQGKLLITVPAFEFLWSTHDVIHPHKRRYSLPPLIRLLERAGYKISFASYINFWLFPVIITIRWCDRLTRGKLLEKTKGNAELKIPSPLINQSLEALFASEAKLIDIIRLPFGVSIILLAEKN